MKTCSTRHAIAVVALLGPVLAWAWDGTTPPSARLLLAATQVAQSDAASEADRMHQRIRQRQQTQPPPAQAPYGTGYEARAGILPDDAGAGERVERVDQVERPDRVDRVERVERVERVDRIDRVDRPAIERGGRGGR